MVSRQGYNGNKHDHVQHETSSVAEQCRRFENKGTKHSDPNSSILTIYKRLTELLILNNSWKQYWSTLKSVLFSTGYQRRLLWLGEKRSDKERCPFVRTYLVLKNLLYPTTSEWYPLLACHICFNHPNGWIAHHRVSGWDLYGSPHNCCDTIASFCCIRLSACPFIVDTANHLSSHPIPSILFLHTNPLHIQLYYPWIFSVIILLSSFLAIPHYPIPPLCPNHLNLCLSLSPNRSAWAVPLTYAFLTQHFQLLPPARPNVYSPVLPSSNHTLQLVNLLFHSCRYSSVTQSQSWHTSPPTPPCLHSSSPLLWTVHCVGYNRFRYNWFFL